MSRRNNHKLISANYSMLNSDQVIIVDTPCTVDLPPFDGSNTADDDGVDLKFTRELYFFARDTFDLNITDGSSVFQINGSTTYTVPAQVGLKLYWYYGRWFIDQFDINASGGTPGAPSGSFQYNNSGVFAGLTGFASNGTDVLVYDSIFKITDDVDPTKILNFQLSGITAATIRTITMVNFSGTQVLSNGALTSTRIPFSGTAGLQDTANLVWDSVNSQLELANGGSAAQPALMFGASIGLYQVSATSLGLSISSSLVLQCDTTSIRSATTGGGIVRVATAAATTPTFSFVGDTNTGIWSTAADTLNFSTGGGDRMTMDATTIYGSANGAYLLRSAAGAAATPTYTYRNDTNTGYYSDAADTIKWSTGGTQRGTIDSTGRMFIKGTTAPTANVHIAAGTATASTAPIKLVTGTLLTTPEDGAIEYTQPLLYYTNNTTVRHTIPLTLQSSTGAVFNKTADTTFAGVTSLTATITNLTNYIFEIYLFCQLDATGGGKFQMNGTSTFTMVSQVEFVDDTADILTIGDNITAQATPVNTVGPTLGCLKWIGHLRCSGTGTFVVEFAQQVASGTSTVSGGSWMRLTQVS